MLEFIVCKDCLLEAFVFFNKKCKEDAKNRAKNKRFTLPDKNAAMLVTHKALRSMEPILF